MTVGGAEDAQHLRSWPSAALLLLSPEVSIVLKIRIVFHQKQTKMLRVWLLNQLSVTIDICESSAGGGHAAEK